MPNDNVTKSVSTIPVVGNSPLDKARAVSKAKRDARGEISDAARFAIRQCQSAAKISKLVADKLRDGESVSPEVVHACGQLAAIGGAEIFS